MADSIFLSIVVPAYNVELYIKDCLDSILKSAKDRDIPQIEVIVVDDGSQDGTQAIVEGYMRSLRLIKIVNEKNEGISNARNKGIRAASGKYIMFVDSDDYLVHDALGKVLDFLRENPNVDLVEFGYYESCEESASITDKTEIPDVTSGSGQFVCSEWVRKDCFNALVWNKVILRSIITDNNIYFYPNISCEDEEWVPRLFAYVANVEFLPYNVYVYRRWKGSITKSGDGTSKKYLDKATICDSLVSFSETKGFSHAYSNALKCCASNIFWDMFNAVKINGEYNEDAIKKINERKYLIPYSKNFKRRWIYRFLLSLLGVKLFNAIRK